MEASTDEGPARGFLDRIFGDGGQDPARQPGAYPQGGYPPGQYPQGGYPPDPRGQSTHGQSTQGQGPDADRVAIERYRYLLRTAPPEMIEQAHAEAFAQLTPDQRRQVLEALSAEVPAGERVASDDPRQLARMATRAEMRDPGVLERSLGRGGMGGMGMGAGMGGLVMGSLLASVAGAFVGTAIADAMFDMSDAGGSDGAGGDDYAAGEGGESSGEGDGGGDYGGDGGGDFGGGDFGGGDFGGGDFGGGDFGGDFGGF